MKHALFANTKIRKGANIAYFGGDVVHSTTPPDGDCIHLNKTTFIKRPEKCATGKDVFAWLANTAGGWFDKNNCKIIPNTRHGAQEAYLQALRDIQVGEELLVSYGTLYPFQKRDITERPAKRLPAKETQKDRKPGRPKKLRGLTREQKRARANEKV